MKVLEDYSDPENPREAEDKEEIELEEKEEEISYEELKKRMWKDQMLMRRLCKDKHDVSSSASLRKKTARAQDAILRNMVKIMEVCKAKGFVYGIVPENGKPVTGSSDSLRQWWREHVSFDRHAPLAIAATAASSSSSTELSFPLDLRSPEDIIGTILSWKLNFEEKENERIRKILYFIKSRILLFNYIYFFLLFFFEALRPRFGIHFCKEIKI